MQDPFAKYADHHHAKIFQGEFLRDNASGYVDETTGTKLTLAAWAAMLEDMKRLVAGKESLPAHRPAGALPSPETPAGRTR
jgi:hypothetical protein